MLTPDQQNAVLIALESGEANGWPGGEVRPEEFFEALRAHTIQCAPDPIKEIGSFRSTGRGNNAGFGCPLFCWGSVILS